MLDESTTKKTNEEQEQRGGKKKFYPAPEVMAVAHKLIEKYHSVLVNARFQYSFRDGTWNKNGSICPGEVKKLSPYVALIANIDFGMIINAKYWALLNTARREALVDHLLSYCSCDEDKDGNLKWVKLNPTIVEFPSVIERHGAYDANLEEMEKSLDEYHKETTKMDGEK